MGNKQRMLLVQVAKPFFSDSALAGQPGVRVGPRALPAAAGDTVLAAREVPQL